MTPDGQGGWVEDYVAVETIRGRMRPASVSERESAAQEQRQISHVFYCTAPSEIARGDRLAIGDLVVEVQGVREPSLAGEHLEVDCMEIQLGQSLEEGS